MFAEAGLGRATAVRVARHHRGLRCTLIALAEGDGGLGSGSGPESASLGRELWRLALTRVAKYRRHEAGWPERAAALIQEARALVAEL